MVSPLVHAPKLARRSQLEHWASWILVSPEGQDHHLLEYVGRGQDSRGRENINVNVSMVPDERRLGGSGWRESDDGALREPRREIVAQGEKGKEKARKRERVDQSVEGSKTRHPALSVGNWPPGWPQV